MQPFNIEIFDRSFNLIQHSNISDLEYNFDYLSTVENSVFLEFNENVEKGQYIRLKNSSYEYFGIITSITVDNEIEGYSELKFKPFISIFDCPILFDTSLQGSTTSLEDMIADYITAYWISNSDDDQNISGLAVETISSTASWGFNIKSDVEGLTYAVVNFMSSIIRRSLTKYQVGLYVTPDFESQTITIEIGIKDSSTFNIEADLPTIIDKSIIINQTDEDINKLVVYDQTDMQTNLVYFKHTDGSYDTTDDDRVTPVIFTITSVTYSEDSTFETEAATAAAQQFESGSYNNLIELTMENDDSLVEPEELNIGQLVNVIANGVTYASILTGFERGTTTKLIFGTLRLDLTKILKERS